MVTFEKIEGVTHEWTPGPRIFSESPVKLAAIQTFEGPDTASVRMRQSSNITISEEEESESESSNVGGGPFAFLGDLDVGSMFNRLARNVLRGSTEIKIEEERSGDAETRHTEEIVGQIAFELGRINNSEGDTIGDAGILEVDQPEIDTWRPLPSPSSFSTDNSVAFVQVLSFNGAQPVHPRLTTSHPETKEAGFYFKMEEWPTYDQQHVPEKLSYVVLNEGHHLLGRGEDPDIEVGTTEPFNYTGDEDNWQRVQLKDPGVSTVVITQCQTFNGSDPIVTRQRMRDSNEFEVRLQEAESQRDHHAKEIVGYVAIGQQLF